MNNEPASPPIAFSEYEKVMRHTEDLTRLQRLYSIKVHGGEMHRLLAIMTEERSWKPTYQINLSLTGRTYGNGRYWYDDQQIVVTDPAPLEVFVHEIAHHDNLRRGPEVRRNPHGPDFVCSLDLCAEIAERRLADFMGTSEE